MKAIYAVSLLAFGSLVGMTAFAHHGRAADTHVIEAVGGNKWKSGNQTASPLIVAAKKGDTLEFRIPGGVHGVATLDKKGDESSPSEDLKYVQRCGEDAKAKPDAVFREAECGAASKVGIRFVGTVKLEILDKFQTDIHFWCVEHTSDMWGTIQFKP